MPRRQDDDWHRRGLSHLGDQFDAALVREAEVEDHQIRLFGRQRPHRAHGVFRFQDSVAGSGKAGTQEAADRWLVVDDKDGIELAMGHDRLTLHRDLRHDRHTDH